MHLEPDTSFITNISIKSVTIKGIDYNLPLLISKGVISDYKTGCLLEIELSDYIELATKYELVLVGTGEHHIWPEKHIYNQLTDVNCKFEFMNNNAAVSTFNMMLSNQREATLLLTN